MALWLYCGPTCQPDSGHMAMFLPSSQAATCLTGRAFLQKHNSQSPFLSQSGRGKPSFQPTSPYPLPAPLSQTTGRSPRLEAEDLWVQLETCRGTEGVPLAGMAFRPPALSWGSEGAAASDPTHINQNTYMQPELASQPSTRVVGQRVCVSSGWRAAEMTLCACGRARRAG